MHDAVSRKRDHRMLSQRTCRTSAEAGEVLPGPWMADVLRRLPWPEHAQRAVTEHQGATGTRAEPTVFCATDPGSVHTAFRWLAQIRKMMH